MTRDQKDTLAHIVIDPDAWMAHAVSVFGQAQAEQFLSDKVARWRPLYESDKATRGANYKTRAQRDAAAGGV